jgi:hypothetical protein
MIVCCHRINTIDALGKIDPSLGIEFDVREGPTGSLIVTHDPWTEGPRLDTFLEACCHRFYIVNIKSEGIEFEVLRLLKHAGIENFFLLDCSFPMIHKLSLKGETRLAVRFSEYEEFRRMQGRARWVWVDVFSRIPLEPKDCDELHSLGYKLCLVSPELQQQPEKLEPYAHALQGRLDMVCTKFPEKWSFDTSQLASVESQPLPSL